jgi:hypothetical protein
MRYATSRRRRRRLNIEEKYIYKWRAGKSQPGFGKRRDPAWARFQTQTHRRSNVCDKLKSIVSAPFAYGSWTVDNSLNLICLEMHWPRVEWLIRPDKWGFEAVINRGWRLASGFVAGNLSLKSLSAEVASILLMVLKPSLSSTTRILMSWLWR